MPIRIPGENEQICLLIGKFQSTVYPPLCVSFCRAKHCSDQFRINHKPYGAQRVFADGLIRRSLVRLRRMPVNDLIHATTHLAAQVDITGPEIGDPIIECTFQCLVEFRSV